MTRGQFIMRRCAVDGMSAVEASSSLAFGRHSHEQFGVGVIEAGAQKSASGAGPVEAGPGDTIMVNPGEVHDGAPLGDQGRAWRMLYFDPALVAAGMRGIHESGAGPCELPPVLRDARLAATFRALYTLATSATAPASPLRLEQLLLVLLARAARPAMPAAPRLHAPVGLARQRIDDDPSAAVSLAELARECGISQFQLLRAFAGATGLTPHAYQVQRRIETARGLIARGASLSEAAFASGFADQSHMTRVFVRKYGISPGQYAAAML